VPIPSTHYGSKVWNKYDFDFLMFFKEVHLFDKKKKYSKNSNIVKYFTV